MGLGLRSRRRAVGRRVANWKQLDLAFYCLCGRWLHLRAMNMGSKPFNSLV